MRGYRAHNCWNGPEEREVSLAICFSVGPILSSALTYLDIRNLLRAEANVSECEYRWETIAGIVVGIVSIGMGITGIAAIATVAHSREDMCYWLDGLVRLLQIFFSPRWAIWAIHLVAISTILDIVSAVTGKTTSSAYESALLARLAAASLLDEDYVRLFNTFVATNAAAASIQLCGAIIVSSLSLAGRSTSTRLRQGIFMVCLRPPSL
ncbi:hypothetical protein EJ07DRAFT_169777 [Lizonia empirigonia]|nr:hypothetical protein EJ07DRAFT_169777 [Lizonia empirigonia]